MKQSKQKMLSLTLVLLFLTFGLNGCSLFNLEPKAEFEINNWDQEYYESFDEYGLVEIDYRITNTGTVDIDSYEVWFEVCTKNDTIFQEWTNGVDIKKGEDDRENIYISTDNKPAASVTIVDYELEKY